MQSESDRSGRGVYIGVVVILVMFIVAILALSRMVDAERDSHIQDLRDGVRQRLNTYEAEHIDPIVVAAAGFQLLLQQPGLVLIEHRSSAACYLAPGVNGAYIEVDAALCADAKKNAATSRSLGVWP